jgi:pantoate--beta-alanine ligase
VELFHFKSELKQALVPYVSNGKSIGLVPTMGALHQGHLSLVERCRAENDVVVVSIFVNPTQFNNQEDLSNYPRNLSADLTILQAIHSESLVVYAPSYEDLYEQGLQTRQFDFGGLELEMEGKFRPGHFDGVGTIVGKLFEIVRPARAYFGEKDYQQLLIIKELVRQLEIPTQIIPCPIYREEDGLAMSSRNERLNASERRAAPLIYKVLQSVKSKFGTENVLEVMKWVEFQFAEEPLLNLEYFTIADAETLKPIVNINKNRTYRAFIAAFAGNVRLIDNIALNN